MDEITRYRRALERIAHFVPDGPANEWSEAEAFDIVRELAADAITPGIIKARKAAEREEEKRFRDRGKQLRKESSAGKRHFQHWAHGAGYFVVILSEKVAPHLVLCKVTGVVNRRSGSTGLGPPDICPPYAFGHVFTSHVTNIYDSPEDVKS